MFSLMRKAPPFHLEFKIYVVFYRAFRVRRFWIQQMYVHLGNQCLIWNKKKGCWSMAIILLLSDLTASNRDGKFYHAPLTTKFTKQTEGLSWEAESDQTISSSYSSSKQHVLSKIAMGTWELMRKFEF